jgi:hypothetical protein
MPIKLEKRPLRHTDPRRRWRSIKRHTLLLLQPLAVALATTALWSFLWGRDIHLATKDTETLTVAIINTLAIFYGLIYAVILSAIWENYKRISVCILQEDKETFLLYRDERIPIMMHLLLGAVSLPLISIIGLLEWHNYWAGFIGIFTIVFAISFFWIAAAELQDPRKSPWMAERIPAEWLGEDIDERFLDEE